MCAHMHFGLGRAGKRYHSSDVCFERTDGRGRVAGAAKGGWDARRMSLGVGRAMRDDVRKAIRCRACLLFSSIRYAR